MSRQHASYRSLTDLPGIGPTKEQWLKGAGIGSIESLRTVPADRLAHIRGIGHPLAARLKELLGVPVPPEAASPVEPGEPQVQWREDTATLLTAVEGMIEMLRANPDTHGLKPKFLKELQRLSETLGEIPLSDPPPDGDQRQKISKHTKAIRTLLESAMKLDERDRNHQKVVRQKLRSRRKKLGKWTCA
jgi:hypothetical protein